MSPTAGCHKGATLATDLIFGLNTVNDLNIIRISVTQQNKEEKQEITRCCLMGKCQPVKTGQKTLTVHLSC